MIGRSIINGCSVGASIGSVKDCFWTSGSVYCTGDVLSSDTGEPRTVFFCLIVLARRSSGWYGRDCDGTTFFSVNWCCRNSCRSIADCCGASYSSASGISVSAGLPGNGSPAI